MLEKVKYFYVTEGYRGPSQKSALQHTLIDKRPHTPFAYDLLKITQLTIDKG